MDVNVTTRPTIRAGPVVFCIKGGAVPSGGLLRSITIRARIVQMTRRRRDYCHARAYIAYVIHACTVSVSRRLCGRAWPGARRGKRVKCRRRARVFFFFYASGRAQAARTSSDDRGGGRRGPPSQMTSKRVSRFPAGTARVTTVGARGKLDVRGDEP